MLPRWVIEEIEQAYAEGFVDGKHAKEGVAREEIWDGFLEWNDA